MIVQRFSFDLVPLVLLIAIAVTGLGLTGSSMLWGGRFYWFISLTHQVTVVLLLLSIPFGKFFHIIQHPLPKIAIRQDGEMLYAVEERPQ